MTHVLRIIAGTMTTLLLVVYFASCQQTSGTGQANIMDTRTESTAVVEVPVEGTRCGVVVDVVDGDTIAMASGARVRMIGIDAPELNASGTPEWYAEESYAKLKTLIENKEVCLEADALQDDMDEYGRLLRYVMIGDENINGLMVAGGFARVYTKKPFEERDGFMYFEQAAQAQKLGLWGDGTEVSANSTTDTTLEFTDEEVVAVGPTTEDNEVAVAVNTVRDDIPSFDASTNEIGGEEIAITDDKADFLTLEEARNAKKYLGQRKTVSFKVRSAWDRGSVVYLNSEKNQKSANNFSIIIPAQYKSDFVSQGLDSIAHFYLGETIEATGTIKFYKGVVMLEVTSFADMHIL